MSDPLAVVSGAQLLIQALQREGADTLFTVPGEPIQDICSAAHEGGMRVVTTRHEQAATFAAQAYSYMSDRIGVAAVVHGVGMANGVTGQNGPPTDFGTESCIGTGIPFAIGAQLARPDKRAFSINGDAAFGFNGLEMETALRVKAPVIFIVLNNDGIGGRLSEEQSLGPGWKGIWSFLPGIRYEKIMEAFGGYAEYVDQPAQIRPALERALVSGKAACLHVAIDPYCSAIPGIVTSYL